MADEYQATIVASDYKWLVRELNKIEPELTKELKQNLKRIAEWPRTAIRESIPSGPPLRGMRRVLSPVGKTWNTRRRANTVTVKMKSPKRGATGVGTKDMAIIQLQVVSPATIIADMAGRGGMKSSINGQKTDWYVYPQAQGTTENTRPGLRRHTVNGQGYAMIRGLGEQPSRYVYPAVEDAMPEFFEEFTDVIEDARQVIERKING